MEHRLFPHLSRVCRGVILQSVHLVAELMRKAKTRTDLSVVVGILDKVYEIGRKVSQAAEDAVKVVRDTVCRGGTTASCPMCEIGKLSRQLPRACWVPTPAFVQEIAQGAGLRVVFSAWRLWHTRDNRASS